MDEKTRKLFGVEFERLTEGPVVAYVTPGRLTLRRKRALWVARAIAVSHRREVRRRAKEQQHGNHW